MNNIYRKYNYLWYPGIFLAIWKGIHHYIIHIIKLKRKNSNIFNKNNTHIHIYAKRIMFHHPKATHGSQSVLRFHRYISICLFNHNRIDYFCVICIWPIRITWNLFIAKLNLSWIAKMCHIDHFDNTQNDYMHKLYILYIYIYRLRGSTCNWIYGKLLYKTRIAIYMLPFSIHIFLMGLIYSTWS